MLRDLLLASPVLPPIAYRTGKGVLEQRLDWRDSLYYDLCDKFSDALGKMVDQMPETLKNKHCDMRVWFDFR